MTIGQTEQGMRYAVRSYGNSAAYCALSVNVGTCNEGGYHGGIAHFTEHTLFKGTSRKSAAVVNSLLESRGGELNAFTTKEEIVLHATVLKEDLARAVSLLAELAFDAQFPDEEIEIEKGVVIDEIASYEDSPAEEIYDKFEEKLFTGTALERPILGTKESVSAITAEELRRFHAEFFKAERMVLSVVAPLEEQEIVRLINKQLKCLSAKQ